MLYNLNNVSEAVDIMADGDIGNVTNRANFMVEDKIPTMDNEFADRREHGKDPSDCTYSLYARICRADQAISTIASEIGQEPDVTSIATSLRRNQGIVQGGS